MEILKERSKQVLTKGKDAYELVCDKASVAGSVSQTGMCFLWFQGSVIPDC